MSDKSFRSDTKRRAEMIRRGVSADSDFIGLVAGAREKQGGQLKGTNARVSTARDSKPLGPRNAIKGGPKSPRTKMNKAVNDLAGAIKEMKPQMDKLKGLKKQADAMKKRMTDRDRARAKKAFDKPSVTDKRSRDFAGRLTKQARNQDPATGGKKRRRRRN